MTHRTLPPTLTLVGAFLLAPPAFAQPAPSVDELTRELATLKAGLEAVQKDLQDLRTMVQRIQAPRTSSQQGVVLDIGARPFRGDRTAKLTLVEVTDYQCPFCSRHVRDTYPQLDAEYIQTGKIKYVVLDLPLESIHKSAFKAAEAVRCAGDQGKYWEMHDRLFSSQQTLGNWSSHAEAVGIDVGPFQICLNAGTHAAEVRKDMAQAQAAGVTGTPGFFLAETDPTGTTVKTLRFLRGAQPLAAFKVHLEELLKAQ